MNLSIVIPTLDRGEVLLETLRHVLKLEPACEDLLVVDQTVQHEPAIQRELELLASRGAIRWLRLTPPSIPGAMNRGLLEARGDVVLFLDDDVEPSPELLKGHVEAHLGGRGEVISGQVLQPGESPEELRGAHFTFRSSVAQPVTEVIGCNFSVNRAFAIGVGGFDELFVRVAYRFEADFCDRALARGAVIFHEPRASLRHLRAPRGGTRSFGQHLKTARPSHAVGEYYYLLRRRPERFLVRYLGRPWRAVCTRHHLARPWWIPVTLCAEILGMAWAIWLVARPPQLVQAARSPGGRD